jgi:hypothetical protein
MTRRQDLLPLYRVRWRRFGAEEFHGVRLYAHRPAALAKAAKQKSRGYEVELSSAGRTRWSALDHETGT